MTKPLQELALICISLFSWFRGILQYSYFGELCVPLAATEVLPLVSTNCTSPCVFEWLWEFARTHLHLQGKGGEVVNDSDFIYNRYILYYINCEKL